METVVLAQDEAALAAFFLVIGLIYVGMFAFLIAVGWRLFVKAGEPGWKVLIPIYNYVIWLQIVGRPWWFVLLFFVPFGGLVVAILVGLDAAKSFGKDSGFAVGLILLAPVFYAILAFGDARYLGPSGGEPRPGWPTICQGGYGAYPAVQQGYYQPPPGQQWGQDAGGQWGQAPADQWGQAPGDQWGQAPVAQGQAPAAEWGQPQQPQQPSWDQQPQPQPAAQAEWGQAPADQWGQQAQQPSWDQQPQQPSWDQQPQQPSWDQQPQQPSWDQQPQQPAADPWGSSSGWGQPPDGSGGST